MESIEKSKKQKVWEVFLAYLRSMLFAFTGGSMTLPLLQNELDNRYHLMDKDKVLEYFAIGQALPGAISLNVGILIGRDIAGWPGAFAAAAGVVFPAFFGMLFIVFSYSFLSRFPFINGFIAGVRAASVAIIFSNAISIIQTSKNNASYILIVFSLFVTLVLKWSMLATIFICGFTGVIMVWVKKKGEKK